MSVIHDSLHPDEIAFVDQMRAEYGPLWVVHRLDRETSGIILFARTAEAHRSLNQQFQERQVVKVYRMLACGAFTWETIVVDLPLVTDGDRRHRTLVDLKNGKPARTEFTVLDAFRKGLFFIQAEPKTGYTHQIRTHLTSLNGAILFDRLYKPHPFPTTDEKPFVLTESNFFAKRYLPINRLALHAVIITFKHPDNGKSISITAPFPGDFYETLGKLKTKGQA